MLKSGSKKSLRVFVLVLATLAAFYPQIVAGKNLSAGCSSSILDWHKSNLTGNNSYRRWIDPAFSKAESDIIEEALRIVVQRIQQKRIWERVEELHGISSLTSEALAFPGLCDEPDIQKNLLFHQLYVLSLPNGENDTTEAFPNIYVRRGYAKEDWVARAPLNTVKIYLDGRLNEWRITDSSKFDITLNDYYLGADGTYEEPEYWAGTFAHEMLHNLGHQHPDLTESVYNKYQIVVIDHLVQSDGEDYKTIDSNSPEDSKEK
jgi:hypothetical protein